MKTIALGITGSIAAYKAADLCSKLSKNKDIEIFVIMTKASLEFIGEQTLLTLSKNPVIKSLWEIPEWKPGHIALADKVDLFAIVPATANIIAKCANGIADDALSTFALSHTAPTFIAPAMNPTMWANQATQNNVEILKERGVKFIGPDTGMVACGDVGTGKLSDVDTIYQTILKELNIS